MNFTLSSWLLYSMRSATPSMCSSRLRALPEEGLLTRCTGDHAKLVTQGILAHLHPVTPDDDGAFGDDHRPVKMLICFASS